ncbi:MAG TPA: glycosyltransferase family 39 protein [Asanoa sp.]
MSSVVEATGSEVDTGSRAAAEPPRRHPPTEGGVRPWLRRPGVGTLLAALVSVPLTLIIFPPPVYADAYWVWRAAELWPHIKGNYPTTVYHHAMRLGTLFPTRLSQEIFGHGQTAWVVASIFLMAMFTAGAFALGRALYNTWIGAVTVLILVVHPFFTLVDSFNNAVSTGTNTVMPDAPSAGLFSLGVAALVVASRRTGRLQTRWLLAAGLCWGLAYLVREYVAFLFPAIVVFFWLLKVPLRRLVVPAAPMLGVLVFELIHNYFVWGDPLARLFVAGEHGGLSAAPLRPIPVIAGFLRAIDDHPLGYVFLLALFLTAAGAVAYRDRRLWLILAWFACRWLPLTLLGGIIEPSEPTIRPQLVRYWYIVLPALLVGALGTIQLTVGRIRRTETRRIVMGSLAALFVLGYLVPAGYAARGVERDQDWRELRAWLRHHPDVQVIYTDSRAVQTAVFYERDPAGNPIWPGEMREFPRQLRAIQTELIGDDLLLLSRFGPVEKPSAANGWEQVWRSENGILSLWRRAD